MKFIDIWYLIVIEKDYDEDDDPNFSSYIEGMWDNYDTALNYVKAVRDNFRNDSDYDRVKNERFFVEGGLIDYSIKIGTKAFEFKVRKKTVAITDKD